MSCKVNRVYAPNGEPSALYDSALKKTKDPEQALSLWTMVHTTAFKEIYGDWTQEDFNGSLDENGEPLLEDVLKEEYIEDADALEQAKKKAEKFTQSAKQLDEYKDKMSDTLTRKIKELERSGTEGSKNFSTKLKKLKTNLKRLDWRQTATDFAAAAKINIEYALRRLDSEMDKAEPNFHLLTRYRNYLSAFDVLEDMSAEIMNNPEMGSSMQEELDVLNSLIAKKNAGKKKYNVFMEDHVADKLSELSSKHDKNTVKEFLKRAPFDITSRQRFLRYAGDSKDTVVALVAKLINEQQQKTRKKSIEFTRDLAGRIDRLEKAYPGRKNNPEELYGPMLERDGNGELTGHFIHPKKNKRAYEKFAAEYAGTELFEFHEFFVKEYERLNKLLPPNSNMETRLPSIMKGKFEMIKSADNKLAQVKTNIRNQFVATNTDMATGEMVDENGQVINHIPIHFTQVMDSATFKEAKKKLLKEGMAEKEAEKQAKIYAIKELPKHISYDLGASLQSFQYMAENFSDMSSIIDVVEGARELVASRKVDKTNSSGNAILNRAKDMNNDRVSIEGTKSNSLKMIESLIEQQVYGMTEKDLGSTLGLDHRKLVKKIMAYNSHLMLGVNVLAGTANIMMGETMQWAEAFGGEYYKPKDYIKASGIYTKSLTEIVGDVGKRLPESKIGLINEEYDILGDYHPGGVGVNENSVVKRAVGSGSIFFINSMGEHMMQSRAIIARMLNTKTYDGSGKETGNLWDAHKAVNGKLTVDKGTYIKVGNELVKYTEKQKRALSRQTQSMLRRMHGNYNKQTAAEWQRNALMGMVGQFRKWIADGFARRWSKKEYSEMADQDLEGNYRTTLKFLGGFIDQLGLFQTEIGTNWSKMTPHEKANVYRTAHEMAVTVAMAISGSLLVLLASKLDDDEDKNKIAALNHMIYLTNRLNTELMFFLNPMDAWQILKSPAASMSVIQQTATTLKYALPWNWEEEYESGVHKGDNRFLVNLGKQVPLYKQIGRMTPDGIKSQLQFYNIN